jgi:hypothetical protein
VSKLQLIKTNNICCMNDKCPVRVCFVDRLQLIDDAEEAAVRAV